VISDERRKFKDDKIVQGPKFKTEGQPPSRSRGLPPFLRENSPRMNADKPTGNSPQRTQTAQRKAKGEKHKQEGQDQGGKGEVGRREKANRHRWGFANDRV